MILELNTQLSDYLKTFSDTGLSSIFADGPIFFLPLFLTGLWLYYTFTPLSLFSPKEEKAHYKEKKRIELIHIFYACILGVVISFVIKQFVDIERPADYLESTSSMLLGKIPEKSFPSDHATVSFAFLSALLLSSYKRVGYIFLPFVIVMNICRIIVGVHWPLDILAGSIVGIFSGYIMMKHLRKTKFVKKLDIAIIGIMKVLKLY